MVGCEDLQIGDYVRVDGVVRRVASITKRKIGYHMESGENRLYYARLADIEPVVIESLTHADLRHGLIVNDAIELECDLSTARLACFSDRLAFENVLGEWLYCKSSYVHDLQHVLKMLFHSSVVKWENKK